MFLEGLKKEIELAGPFIEPKTIYVGGGTPTVLSPHILATLFEALSQFPHNKLEEFTVEVNPGSLTREILGILKKASVSRISIGAQSFNNEHLRFLGRPHNAKDIEIAFDLASEAGFNSISIDMIADIPNSSRDEWRYELQSAVALAPQHISYYSLSIEHNTPLEIALKQGKFVTVSNSESAHRLLETSEFLRGKGYEHYEISNYAKPEHQSIHNMIYWRNGSYLGLGPSAASFVNGVRRKNVSDLVSYCEALRSHQLPIVESEKLSPQAFAGETAMLMLRRRKGINASEFFSATGYEPFNLFKTIIHSLAEDKLIEITENTIRIPDDKLPVADSIIAEFLVVPE